MNDEEYCIFETAMNELFINEGEDRRLIIGESPYPITGVLKGMVFETITLLKKYLFRETKATGNTLGTFNKIMSLVFGSLSDTVMNLLKENKLSQDYLVKYLLDNQNYAFTNGFSNTECSIISRNLREGIIEFLPTKVLVTGNEILRLSPCFCKCNPYFIIHPTGRNGTKSQWTDFDFQGDEKYHSSEEIVNSFRLKMS